MNYILRNGERYYDNTIVILNIMSPGLSKISIYSEAVTKKQKYGRLHNKNIILSSEHSNSRIFNFGAINLCVRGQ